MNERIKELWKQATEYAFSVTTLNETPKEWEELKLAKFAELIVQDCANVTVRYLRELEGADFGTKKLMLEHFGIAK
jgi:hypothetical protein